MLLGSYEWYRGARCSDFANSSRSCFEYQPHVRFSLESYLEPATPRMLPFLLPPRVCCSLIHRSATFARRQVPSTSASCSRSFVTTREDQPEDLEGTEGELDESDPWSQFQMDDFDSVGGGVGRKGGRSRPGASAGSADAWLTGEGLQFKRPGEGKPNWLGVSTVRPRRDLQFFGALSFLNSLFL